MEIETTALTRVSVPGQSKREVLGELQLGASIVFFGLSFVGQRFAMGQNIGPLTYNVWRFIVSTALLVSLRPYLQSVADTEYESVPTQSTHDEESSFADKENESQSQNSGLWDLWYWGSICGVSNYVGSVLQQIALVTVPVGKVGFITGMYVVVVPVVEWCIPGRKHGLTVKSWVAAFTSVVGMFFLSGCATSSECFSGDVGKGEILVFISVLAWVVSILASDIGAKKADCISLTCVDFIVCTILNVITAFFFAYDELLNPSNFSVIVWASIIMVGATEAAAFTLSTLGQMYTPASRAALLLSLETVSSALGGYLVLGETLKGMEILGCIIMFAATLISTIDWGNLLSPKEEPQRIVVRRTSWNRPRAKSLSLSSQTKYSVLDRDNVIDMGRILVRKHSQT